MAYETVLYDVADRICTITLNRPERLNAWTKQMHVDLKDAMHAAGANPDVRAIILTGAGRGFCAGADMAGLQDQQFRRRRRRPLDQDTGHAARRQRPCRIPHELRVLSIDPQDDHRRD